MIVKKMRKWDRLFDAFVDSLNLQELGFGKSTPDCRTLSDFRKDNIECMEPVFKEFNRYCMRLKILSKSFISRDGTDAIVIQSAQSDIDERG